jgi:peptidoglycan/LPS O-acetylase OafA/YrhL
LQRLNRLIVSCKKINMLQRIQTIWLLLAGVAAFLTLKLNSVVAEDINRQYTPLNALNSGTEVLIATILIGLIAFITIFLYKNRLVQLRLCIGGILLQLVLVFLYYKKASTFTSHSITIAVLLHLAVIVGFILAASGINKDEKLVKDSNRLR